MAHVMNCRYYNRASEVLLPAASYSTNQMNTKYEDERSKLEKEIHRLVRSFEERTEFIVSEVQLLREPVDRPMLEKETSVLLGVRMEVEGKG